MKSKKIQTNSPCVNLTKGHQIPPILIGMHSRSRPPMTLMVTSLLHLANYHYQLLQHYISLPFQSQGHHYFLTLVDDHSQVIRVYLMKFKSEVKSLLQYFIHMVETQFNAKIKQVRSDNGPKFHMPEFYDSHGILHQKSCVYTPQQNGVAEIKHQNVLSVT